MSRSPSGTVVAISGPGNPYLPDVIGRDSNSTEPDRPGNTGDTSET
jgi:hypothetical protein